MDAEGRVNRLVAENHKIKKALKELASVLRRVEALTPNEKTAIGYAIYDLGD